MSPYSDSGVKIFFLDVHFHQRFISVRVILESKLFIEWQNKSINFLRLVRSHINVQHIVEYCCVDHVFFLDFLQELKSIDQDDLTIVLLHFRKVTDFSIDSQKRVVNLFRRLNFDQFHDLEYLDR